MWAFVCGIVCACGESVCELLEASKGESVIRLRGLEGQGFALMVRHRKVRQHHKLSVLAVKRGCLLSACVFCL